MAYLTHPDTLKPHVNFLMVDTRNGKIILRRDLGMGLEYIDIVEDPGTRALYFCAFRYVWLFDAATGRLVQRVNVSTPHDIPGNRLALDAPHHHLFIWGHHGIEVLTQTAP